MKPLSEKVVIVGAGPAGLLLAHYLLRRGYRVDIYDRRPDPRQGAANQQRTFPISLQARGRQALQGIPGLEAALMKHGVLCQGTCLHRQRSVRTIQRRNPVLAIDRNQLVRVLLEQLVSRYPDSTQLQLMFGCSCQEINFAAQTLRFQTRAGGHFTVSYRWVIGADGAGSQIRQELTRHGDLHCQQTRVPDAYKSIFLSRINSQLGVELAANFIHVSNLGNDVRIILAPQPGDRLHGAFIFNGEHNPLEGLTTGAEVLQYFADRLPNFRPLLSQTEAEALLQRPAARLWAVECDRFHAGERMLILGDAAHAVSPAIGQGCNAALEDAAALNQLLDRYGDDWSQVLWRFSQLRVPEAHALRQLSDYTFPRGRGLGVEFFLQLLVRRKLHEWFPRWFSPFVFDLILDTDLAYTEVLRRSRGWIERVKRG